MKYLLSLLLITAGFYAFAEMNSETQSETSKIYVELDGEYEPVEVDSAQLEGILNHAFYECKRVPGGWRRCSKRNGRCFGAVFRVKHQCEAALHPDDD